VDEGASTIPPSVLAEYGLEGGHIEPLSGGRTNRTLRARAGRDLVVQQLLGSAHADVLGVMENLVRVTSHLEWRRSTQSNEQVWFPQLVPTSAGKPFIMTETGDVWRAFTYRSGQILRSAQPLATLASAGALYGRFSSQTADLGGPPLIESSPGFHSLERVHDQLVTDLEQAEPGLASAVQPHMGRIDELCRKVAALAAADGLGESPDRVVHNDTKLSNVLFDRDHGRATAVLDLDLAMMGPCWHDVGDLVRSACWHGPDSRGEPAFSVELFDAVAGAFAESAAESVIDAEIVTYAVAGARLSLELGLRYMNDHLRAEPELLVRGESGHLHRGLANVNLADEMLGAYDALRHVVDGFIADR